MLLKQFHSFCRCHLRKRKSGNINAGTRSVQSREQGLAQGMDMIFPALDHEMINVLVERRAAMEKNIKEWSRVRKLAAETLQKPGAMSGTRSFEKDIS